MNNQAPKDWNIEAMVNAVIADDNEAAQIAGSLKTSLQQVKAGQYNTAYTPSLAVAARQKTGLSQSKFAHALNISLHTLKSWETGQRKPSGAAETLLKILDKHPELLREIQAA
ncbi:helix-turn-helix domain-containing protein [Neisseriaceae bacterium B1]